MLCITYYENKGASKRKKSLIVNSILVGGIAILVVSLVFTFCAKIADKDDVKNDSNLSEMSF